MFDAAPAAQVHPEGKYVVDCDKSIDIANVKPAARVALRNDSYALHVLLPSKVDPLVSLMKVEKVPDSTYDMVGGLDQQARARAACASGHAPRPRPRCPGAHATAARRGADQGDQGGGGAADQAPRAV